jgi:hypothetical protein
MPRKFASQSMKLPLAFACSVTIAVLAAGAFVVFGLGGGKDPPPSILLPPDDIGPAEAVENEGAVAITAAPIRDCGPAVDAEFLASNQILAYYGNPYVPAMGILGELEPEELVLQLEEHAARYDELNGPRGVQPAFHIVYASAQPDPGKDGLHLIFVDKRTLNEYIDLACEHDILVFLDNQIGRSEVETEMRDILVYLDQPHVHAALDPEFAMPAGEVPGDAIGTMDAAEVNAAQAVLQTLVEERGLPDKMLVVHRFTDDMVTRSELIQDLPRVRVVMDMDGFGPGEIKQVKFGWYAAPAEYSGIKLFFKQDVPLMSEADVLELDPDVIIYQ